MSDTSDVASVEMVPVLDVRDVTKTFPGVIANEDITFALDQGEIHCLLGENGAGTSTLMNVVFGLYQPDSGSIRVRGEPVFERAVQVMRLVPAWVVHGEVHLGIGNRVGDGIVDSVVEQVANG